MSTVISCTLLSGRPAAAPSSSSGNRSRFSPSGKAAVVAASSFQRPSRPAASVCFASNPKGEQYGPKTDLPPFSIPPVALVHPVSPREERWQMEEEADAVSMWFEVPGLSKEDLVVELDEDVLIIRKKARDELDVAGLEQRAATNSYRAGRAETAAATTDVGGSASYRGSSASYKVDASRNRADAAGAVAQDRGIYARLLVPAGYSKESIEAELASGVLRVTIGKVKQYARRRINVDIHVK